MTQVSAKIVIYLVNEQYFLLVIRKKHNHQYKISQIKLYI